MRVFVLGATGALGAQLVPLLVSKGHFVVGATRSGNRIDQIRSMGAEGVLVDALDRDALVKAVRAARPDAIHHQLTAIPQRLDLRKFDREFEPTNRLRTAGTDNMLAAAEAASVKQVIAQSFGGWPYARVGGPVKTEQDPLDPDPPAALRRTLEAIRYLEQAVLGQTSITGAVLRYGGFYGPGTSLALNGAHVADIRARRFPLVGRGTGIWSFIHIRDAAAATVSAMEREAAGVYNVADDDPAPVAEWLPYLAECVGAKSPLRVPAWLARLLVGEHAVVLLNEIRGISNNKIRRELGWEPRFPSWKQGFRHGLENSDGVAGRAD